MASTQKRLHLCLSKEDERQVKFLSQKFGESPSKVIHRAIAFLFCHEDVHSKQSNLERVRDDD